MGYLFENNYEVSTRYTSVDLAKGLANTLNTKEYTLGLSKYIVGHKLKVQSDVSYIQTENTSEPQLSYSFPSRNWKSKFIKQLLIIYLQTKINIMKKSLTIFKSFLLAVIMLLSVNSFANEATSNIKLSNGIFKNLSTSPIEGGACIFLDDRL